MTTGQTPGWAHRIFGRARLGDKRLTRRAVELAAAAARKPGGAITQVVQGPAEREGAFRFVENDRVGCEALTEAVGEAAALDCREHKQVLVPIDQADLTFVDRQNVRGLGPVNNRNSRSLRGLQVMNALALDKDGTSIGILDQQWWIRSETPSPKSARDKRPAPERESWKWIETLRACVTRLRKHAPHVDPCFIMDRGADFGALFEEARRLGVDVIVRATQNRTLLRNGKKRRLKSTLARQPILGEVQLQVPGGHGRIARTARFELRALASIVRIRVEGKQSIELSAVRLREISQVPAGEDPIEWTLLTNRSVKSAADAVMIVDAYTLRWRIEEFHKTWKSGACNVESSQLRSFGAIRRWATILAAVAARVERLKHLSRTTPDADALEEFSAEEIETAIHLTRTKKFKIGEPISLWDATCLVAQCGGYMNRRSDGPPGSITIRRGLEMVVPAAAVLRASRERSG